MYAPEKQEMFQNSLYLFPTNHVCDVVNTSRLMALNAPIVCLAAENTTVAT
jgi:hypothetical protein